MAININAHCRCFFFLFWSRINKVFVIDFRHKLRALHEVHEAKFASFASFV